MRTPTLTTFLLALAAMAARPIAAPAAMNETPRRVADVPDAFRGLAPRGEWLGYHPRFAPVTFAPRAGVNSEQHYQGIQRTPRVGGPPILYVTRSGDIGDAADPGGLQVVRMGSRTRSGERMRSNRLAPGAETQVTEARDADEVIRFIAYPEYEHPGGLQMVGDVLAVPLEGKDEARTDLPEGLVLFYDCQQPDDPRLLPVRLEIDDHEVGVLGLVRLPDGAFLVVLGWGDGDALEFYRSTRPSFLDRDMRFELHDIVSSGEITARGFWRTGKTTPQSLNFLLQEDGRLFLVGSSNANMLSPFVVGPDEMFLWEVTGWNPGESIVMDTVATQSRGLHSEGEPLITGTVSPRQEANFNAAAGVHVTPTGELLYYGASYYNEGPGGITQLAELHHVKVSQRGTCGPQVRPNHLGGPHSIPEGSTLRLEGAVHVVEPWVSMFGDPGLGGPMVTMDAIDQDEDDYANFSRLDGVNQIVTDGFNDDLDSFLWCGEPGTVLRLFDDDGFREGSVRTLERAGTGRVERVDDVGSDFSDEATSARISWEGADLADPFLPRPRTYTWDLDGDGTFESLGIGDGRAADFDAGAGSSTTEVSMRFGEVEARTTVNVVNLPPVVASLTVAPSVAREGQVVAINVSWRDAVADGHVARVTWGDGTGDALDLGVLRDGAFMLTHVYADDGAFTISACVDDGEAEGCRSLVLALRNAAPVLDLGGDVSSEEGRIVTLSRSFFTDPGTLDTHVATVDWGDGTGAAAAAVAESPFGPPGSATGLAGSFTADHVYADDGTYDVLACVTDDDGASDCRSVLVRVANAAPVVRPSVTLRADEGARVALPPVVFTDPGTLDSHVATVDWADGTGVAGAPVSESPFGPPGSTAGMTGTVAADHVYADDGTYDVLACVTDDDGASGCGVVRVVVANVAPLVVAGADVVSVEAGGVALAPATFHDAGTLDSHVAVVSWGDELAPVSGVVTESPHGPPGSTLGLDGTVGSGHVYGDDGVYVVQVCVTDDDGGTGCDTFSVTVRNVAPEVALDLGPQVVFPGGTAFLARRGVEAGWRADARDDGSDDLAFGWSVVDRASGDVVLDLDEVRCNDPSGASCPDPLPSSQSHHFPMVVEGAQATMAFGQHGVQDLSLVVSDDDGGMAAAGAVVVVTDDQRCGRGLGGWRRAVREPGDRRLSADALTRDLSVAAFASATYPELLCSDASDASCLLDAARLALGPGGLDLPGDAPGAPRSRAYRAAVAAWLDFAAGAVAWDQEVRPTGLTFGDLIAEVEGALLDAAATPARLAAAERLARSVNESFEGSGGCGHD